MLETGFAQIRFAASILFGTRFSLRSLDHLIASLQATQREFGFLRSEGRDLLVSPQLDEQTRRAMQLRRFRSQAVRREQTFPFTRPAIPGLPGARTGRSMPAGCRSLRIQRAALR